MTVARGPTVLLKHSFDKNVSARIMHGEIILNSDKHLCTYIPWHTYIQIQTLQQQMCPVTVARCSDSSESIASQCPYAF